MKGILNKLFYALTYFLFVSSNKKFLEIKKYLVGEIEKDKRNFDKLRKSGSSDDAVLADELRGIILEKEKELDNLSAEHAKIRKRFADTD